jgi:hypothetical protein
VLQRIQASTECKQPLGKIHPKQLNLRSKNRSDASDDSLDVLMIHHFRNRSSSCLMAQLANCATAAASSVSVEPPDVSGAGAGSGGLDLANGSALVSRLFNAAKE